MKSLIIANWKMNPQTLAEAKQLFDSIKKGISNIKNIEIIICPPFVFIPNLTPQISNLKLGAQNCFWEAKGAYTGEISPLMLKKLGCRYVIVGHSERRRYFGETDEMINKKIKAVLKNGLKPVLAVENTVQCEKCLKGISKKELKKIILAYEPIWAIGTGKACGISEAKKANLEIRKVFKENVILYGGSVNSQNAGNYMKEAGFQGLLVGSASLKPKEFIKIVKAVN